MSVSIGPKNITKKQLAVLKQLYRFRFGTSDLIARSLDLKDGRYIHMRLDALVKQKYIGKNYDRSYKLEGKPATYYLLPKAFAALKEYANTEGKEVSLKTLRNTYKDNEASDRFIAKKLAIFTIHNKLKASYGDSLGFWTKEQLNFDKYNYFPTPKPDTYLSITPEGVRPRARHFFLNYLDNETPFFVHARHLQEYVAYTQDEEWEEATNSKLRGVLLVCESASLLKRVRKKLAQVVDEDEVPKFCYTTLDALKRSTIEDEEVWQIVGKPLEIFGLREL